VTTIFGMASLLRGRPEGLGGVAAPLEDAEYVSAAGGKEPPRGRPAVRRSLCFGSARSPAIPGLLCQTRLKAAVLFASPGREQRDRVSRSSNKVARCGGRGSWPVRLLRQVPRRLCGGSQEPPELSPRDALR
jgi:hypothetical protein